MGVVEDSSRPSAGHALADWSAGLLLAVAAVGLYLGGLRNPFVYDDFSTVVQNPSIRQLGDIRAVLWFGRARPLVNLSYAVDHAFWGLNPLGFHLTNVLLHALSVVLVFVLLRHLVQDCRVHGRGTWQLDAGPARLIPLIVAALFAVHPMMTESVGYVSGRSDVLSGTFFLLAVLLMRRGLVSGRVRWVALSLVPFILAVASKEVAIMFPFVVLAYAHLILRPSGPESRRWLLRLHLPLIGAAVLVGAARVVLLLAVEHPFSSQSLGLMLGYLRLQCVAVWMYVRLLVWPWHQSIAHNVSGLVSLSALGAIALLATCVLAYRARARAPLISFGIAWFLLLLAPSSSVVPLQHPVAEHRVYLASIGLFLIAATLFARLVQGLRGRPVGLLVGLSAAGLVALGGLAFLTVSRTVVWADPVALWREAATTAPRWDTYTALGNALRDARDCESALVAYRIASQIDPGRLLPVAASWLCLTTLGKTAEAQAVVQRILRVDPQLTRLCGEVHVLAPHIVSVQSCVERLRPHFRPAPGG
jgi:hypothetical protein